MGNGPSRRRVLGAGLTACTGGIVGCTEQRDADTRSTSSPTSETQPDATTSTGTHDDRERVRTVGAHYYVWYGAPAHDGPDGEWSLESPSTPVLGNYNSTESDVIARHVDWCHSAGITWLNASWWGPSSHSNARLADEILDHHRAGELEWSILYEVPGRFAGGIVDMDDPANRDRLREDLVFLAEEFFERDLYKRIDDRPVLYIYSANSLGERGDLVEAYELAVAAIDDEPYLIADVIDPTTLGTPDVVEIADALTIYNPYVARQDIESVFDGQLEKSYRAWHVARGLVDVDLIPTVIPGFNDSELTHVDRDNPILEASPERYERAAESTVKYADGPVFVTSFNEWYEDTQIEPSETYGEQYLEITADVLATSDPDPPSIDGDSLGLEFEKTVPEGELNPVVEHGRNLTLLCTRLRITDAAGVPIVDASIGNEEADILFLMGAYGVESQDSTTWRWFGNGRRTLLHTPELPSRGTVEITGRAAADMTVEIQVNGAVSGTGRVQPHHDVYRIGFGDPS